MRIKALLTPVMLLLAACGAAPGNDTLFPLAEGKRWTYRVSTVIDEAEWTRRETLVLANRGSDTIDGAPSWRRRSDAGIEYWLRSDATGIYRIASRNPLEREPQLDKPRRYVLQKPYAVGTEWEAPTTAYVLARKNEVPREVRYIHKAFPMHYRIEALAEKVKTPAGEFEGCLRVSGRAEIRLYVDAMFQWRDIPLATLEWYCPGVGLVKLERKEASPTKFMVGGTVTMELTSWQ
ncbi:MAG: hypothetical protein ABL916_09660 [Burkholderiaceae bacterium]